MLLVRGTDLKFRMLSSPRLFSLNRLVSTFMSRKKLVSVVGARPNFMKMAPLVLEIGKRSDRFHSVLVHTGQHYDETMSGAFFRDLRLKAPDYNLDVRSGSHAFQTAEIMKGFEEICLREKPHLVVVAGDVNSTLACALTAAKLRIPVAHVEAGLRSFDRAMPEEINRIVTDCLSDLLFVTEASGVENLRREGIAAEKVHFVGNTMIDSLIACSNEMFRNGNRPRIPALEGRPFCLATIHRPANVDDFSQLEKAVDILEAASEIFPIVFAAHPRTRQRLSGIEKARRFLSVEEQMTTLHDNSVCMLPPLSYLDFLYAMSKAKAVLTDSGGIQEETTFLGVPCLTLRDSTERPVSVELGSNEIVHLDKARILDCLHTIKEGRWKKSKVPPLWDGKAAARIVQVLDAFFR